MQEDGIVGDCTAGGLHSRGPIQWRDYTVGGLQ